MMNSTTRLSALAVLALGIGSAVPARAAQDFVVKWGREASAGKLRFDGKITLPTRAKKGSVARIEVIATADDSGNETLDIALKKNTKRLKYLVQGVAEGSYLVHVSVDMDADGAYGAGDLDGWYTGKKREVQHDRDAAAPIEIKKKRTRKVDLALGPLAAAPQEADAGAGAGAEGGEGATATSEKDAAAGDGATATSEKDAAGDAGKAPEAAGAPAEKAEGTPEEGAAKPAAAAPPADAPAGAPAWVTGGSGPRSEGDQRFFAAVNFKAAKDAEDAKRRAAAALTNVVENFAVLVAGKYRADAKAEKKTVGDAELQAITDAIAAAGKADENESWSGDGKFYEHLEVNLGALVERVEKADGVDAGFKAWVEKNAAKLHSLFSKLEG